MIWGPDITEKENEKNEAIGEEVIEVIEIGWSMLLNKIKTLFTALSFLTYRITKLHYFCRKDGG